MEVEFLLHWFCLGSCGDVLIHIHVVDTNYLRNKADLIEELARLEGYDKLPKEPILPKYHKVQSSLENYLRTYFKFKGYNEVINYSFVDSLDEDIFL